MQRVASSTDHPFDRIYVASSASSVSITQVYPPPPNRIAPPDLSKSNTMKALEIRSMNADASKGGVVQFRLGEEFKPKRQVVLTPLDP